MKLSGNPVKYDHWYILALFKTYFQCETEKTNPDNSNSVLYAVYDVYVIKCWKWKSFWISPCFAKNANWNFRYFLSSWESALWYNKFSISRIQRNLKKKLSDSSNFWFIIILKIFIVKKMKIERMFPHILKFSKWYEKQEKNTKDRKTNDLLCGNF